MPTGIPNLVVNTSGNLAMNVKNIVDAPNPGSLTVSTTSCSSTIALNSGTTAQLCPGTGVTATGLPAGNETIASVIDSTHFAVSIAATSSQSSNSPTFASHTGLTKTGAGNLDLSLDNKNTNAFTFTGPLVVNGGLVLVNSDSELGGNLPANYSTTSFNAAAVVLNGGEIDTTSTAAWNLNRGITVGPQGGTVSLAGAGGASVPWRTSVTGPGGMTFSAYPYTSTVGTAGDVALVLQVSGTQV